MTDGGIRRRITVPEERQFEHIAKAQIVDAQHTRTACDIGSCHLDRERIHTFGPTVEFIRCYLLKASSSVL